MCGGGGDIHARVHMSKSEGKLRALVYFYHMDTEDGTPGDGTPVVGLGGKCFAHWSHDHF